MVRDASAGDAESSKSICARSGAACRKCDCFPFNPPSDFPPNNCEEGARNGGQMIGTVELTKSGSGLELEPGEIGQRFRRRGTAHLDGRPQSSADFRTIGPAVDRAEILGRQMKTTNTRGFAVGHARDRR